ncbi:hypothetical protein [Thermofilum pendens]|uniref:Uncharacterized protein n=1 Tax=Thermofilum pendens (strain DSM 2475 / Hrk 5) TaxID=368408 RepID=A1RZJ7_THEPD|nr:hypothetical protein [Thermofilum pendens]ABL78627.1 hypothetical protein Tpen_1229 [Thermofilum pendens Hrk 5]
MDLTVVVDASNGVDAKSLSSALFRAIRGKRAGRVRILVKGGEAPLHMEVLKDFLSNNIAVGVEVYPAEEWRGPLGDCVELKVGAGGVESSPCVEG